MAGQAQVEGAAGRFGSYLALLSWAALQQHACWDCV